MIDLSVRPFDVRDDAQVSDLIRLHGEYCAESFGAGGTAEGYAVSWYLRTALMYAGGEAVGYFSYDPAPPTGIPAIELIYVTHSMRRRGIASSVVLDGMKNLSSSGPGLHLKAPLTPACASMAEKLGVESTVMSSRERAEMEASARAARRAPYQWCQKNGHRRAIAFTACAKCTEEFPYLLARTHVECNISLIRGTGMTPGDVRTGYAAASAARDAVLTGRVAPDWVQSLTADLRPLVEFLLAASHQERSLALGDAA